MLAPALAGGVTLTKSWAEPPRGTKVPVGKQGTIRMSCSRQRYEVPIA